MSQVIPFRPAQTVSHHPADIAALSARLIQVESAETDDEDLLDLLVEAEVTALGALAKAQAVTAGEVVLKLTALVRRLGEERDGPLCEGELKLLRSTLRDMQRLAATVPAAAATA
jgi:hypothetical protein